MSSIIELHDFFGVDISHYSFEMIIERFDQNNQEYVSFWEDQYEKAKECYDQDTMDIMETNIEENNTKSSNLRAFLKKFSTWKDLAAHYQLEIQQIVLDENDDEFTIICIGLPLSNKKCDESKEDFEQRIENILYSIPFSEDIFLDEKTRWFSQHEKSLYEAYRANL